MNQSIVEENVKLENLSPEVILIHENRLFIDEVAIKNEIKEENEDKELTTDDETVQNSYTNDESVNSTDEEELPPKTIEKKKLNKKAVKDEENSTKKQRKVRSDKQLENVNKVRKKPNHTMYSCDICGKMYQNQHLAYHLNAHNSKLLIL